MASALCAAPALRVNSLRVQGARPRAVRAAVVVRAAQDKVQASMRSGAHGAGPSHLLPRSGRPGSGLQAPPCSFLGARRADEQLGGAAGGNGQ